MKIIYSFVVWLSGCGVDWLPFGWSRTLSLGQPSEVVLMITFWLITFLLHTQKGDCFFLNWYNCACDEEVFRYFDWWLHSKLFSGIWSLFVCVKTTNTWYKQIGIILFDDFFFHGNFVSHHICHSFRSFFIYYFRTRICPITFNNKSM